MHRRYRTNLLSPETAFYAWIYNGSLRRAANMLAYHGLKPRNSRHLSHMTISNLAKKSKAYKAWVDKHGEDAEFIGTKEEKIYAKEMLRRRIPLDIKRLVDIGNMELEKPYQILKKEGLVS